MHLDSQYKEKRVLDFMFGLKELSVCMGKKHVWK